MVYFITFTKTAHLLNRGVVLVKVKSYGIKLQQH